ncbi:MAG: peptide deformylase [Firmicutes bacterium]|nr:peptide deformylase [Bacillota bacterium]
MAIREIRKEGDPVLRRVAKEVTKFTPELKKLARDMADTMYDADGVGLAAPQIGVSKRIWVIDVGDGLFAMVNPEITLQEGEQIGPEGCLSIPGYSYETSRYEHVICKGYDLDGNEKVVEGNGLLARALQHETDHLNGILFVDRLRRFVAR